MTTESLYLQHTLNRMQGGPWEQPASFREEKFISPGNELSFFGQPAHRLVTIPTELSQLHKVVIAGY